MLHRMTAMRRLGLFVWALALGLACRNGKESAPKASANPATASSASRVVELYFTTSVQGYVEPCGCTTEPLGGLPRLASVVKSGRTARALVDTGNLLFPTHGVDDVTREQHVLKAHVIARAYRSLGAIGLNVGAADLTVGTEFL